MWISSKTSIEKELKIINHIFFELINILVSSNKKYIVKVEKMLAKTIIFIFLD